CANFDHPPKITVLKSLAILPSGSAGKFLKKIWNFGQLGGRGSEFCFRTTTTPLKLNWSIDYL
ncbi:hypothetical protein, partial [Enterococcus gallinarum]|uniref:hypothetical protein n=1 Tax=Enterococcus gallinarum TaxID=1353 RepID=UPI00257BB79B